MSATRTAGEQITEEVTSWPGVEAGPGQRGEFAFTLGRREIGHLHGDHVLHTGFPKAVWNELHAEGGSTITRSSPASRATQRAGSRPRTTFAT